MIRAKAKLFGHWN